MAINLGNTAAVYRITNQSVETIDDASVEAYLQEADRLIQTQTSPQYMQDTYFANVIQKTGLPNLSYNTFFPIKVGTTITVYVDGVLKTDTVDYNVSGSTVTFTDSSGVYIKSKIIFYYTPEFFDDYANYLAAQRLQASSLINTDNAVAQANYDNIKAIVVSYTRTVMNRPILAKFSDHAEGYGVF